MRQKSEYEFFHLKGFLKQPENINRILRKQKIKDDSKFKILNKEIDIFKIVNPKGYSSILEKEEKDKKFFLKKRKKNLEKNEINLINI